MSSFTFSYVLFLKLKEIPWKYTNNPNIKLDINFISMNFLIRKSNYFYYISIKFFFTKCIWEIIYLYNDYKEILTITSNKKLNKNANKDRMIKNNIQFKGIYKNHESIAG